MDYVKLRATATRLIQKNGGDCVFARKGLVAADPTKPWRSPVVVESDPPENTDPVSVTVRAVIVPMEIKDEPANGVRRASKAVLYAIADFGDVDANTLETVNNGIATWKICDVQPIAPAGPDSLVCYQMELEG